MFILFILDHPPSSPIVNMFRTETKLQNETIYRTMYVFFLLDFTKNNRTTLFAEMVIDSISFHSITYEIFNLDIKNTLFYHRILERYMGKIIR